MIAILKRELRSYFYSPIGYIFIGFFLLLSGFFFAGINLNNRITNMKYIFGNLTTIFLFLTPILTMRLIAEEKNSKTDQLLLTSPVNLTGIVFGKFFAALSVFVAALLITGIYPIIIIALKGNPPMGEILGAYLGFFLLGMSFISIGMFISALTENQLISAIATFGTLLILFIINWISGIFKSPIIATVIDWLSVVKRFDDFSGGLLGVRPVLYYLSFTAIFVFLTIRALESRRWS